MPVKKKEEVKKEEVKEIKKDITNDEFLAHKPQTFSNQRCGDCGGSGLSSSQSLCGRCLGTGLIPAN